MTRTLALCLVATLHLWPLLQTDPRACLVARLSTDSAKVHAIQCAQDFIARNGYTAKPPTVDSASMAHESIVFTTSVADELRDRRNSLEEHAVGVCSGSRGDSTGFTVVFRTRSHSGGARAVTMDAQFQELRVEHVDFRLDVVMNRRYGCEPLSEHR
jgi:hypothetical protein